jgi:hypothetical protein
MIVSWSETMTMTFTLFWCVGHAIIGKDARSRIYLPHFEGEPSNEPMSALEVAISGRAKHFISNPLVQEIISTIPDIRVYVFDL